MSLTKTLKSYSKRIIDWLSINLFNDNLIWGLMTASVLIMIVGIFLSAYIDAEDIISIGLVFGIITITSIIIKAFLEIRQRNVKYQ
ncbi:MAG: hypothetical protein WBN94_08005 [Methanothrix sp.]